MKIFKRLFCKHDYRWSENIHGDMIIALGWKRSIWECSKCGKVIYSDLLDYFYNDKDNN